MEKILPNPDLYDEELQNKGTFDRLVFLGYFVDFYTFFEIIIICIYVYVCVWGGHFFATHDFCICQHENKPFSFLLNF